MRRIQIEVPEDRAQELEQLKSELRIATLKDLINNALAILEWAVEERRAGHSVASIDRMSDRYYELILPALMAVKPRPRAHGAS
jgi:hypothetical protein